MANENTNIVTKKDLFKLFLRGIGLQFSWNYERMQALGYCYTILPLLKKIYKDDEAQLNEAVVRNLEFFNTHPYMAMPIIGATTAMEESKKLNHNIDGNAIGAVKVSLMGPFAGIGDSFFWFTLFPICAGIGISLSQGGSLLGPLVFLLLFNIFNLGTRYYGLLFGYRYGNQFVEKLSGSGIMKRITEATTIVGLMVLGVMAATMVNLPLDFVVGSGEQAMSLQMIFDSVMPKLIPLLLTLAAFKLIKKGISTTKVLFLAIGLSILGAFVGLF